MAVVSAAGQPAMQHLPVANIFAASAGLAPPEDAAGSPAAGASTCAAREHVANTGEGDGSANAEQGARSVDHAPNPFAAITAWDEAHAAARAPQPGDAAAPRTLVTAASASVVLSDIETSHCFCSAGGVTLHPDCAP